MAHTSLLAPSLLARAALRARCVRCNRRYLTAAAAALMASGAAGANKRSRETHPPPGTRVWAGAPPSESLHCSICTEVFKEVRV